MTNCASYFDVLYKIKVHDRMRLLCECYKIEEVDRDSLKSSIRANCDISISLYRLFTALTLKTPPQSTRVQQRMSKTEFSLRFSGQRTIAALSEQVSVLITRSVISSSKVCSIFALRTPLSSFLALCFDFGYSLDVLALYTREIFGRFSTFFTNTNKARDGKLMKNLEFQAELSTGSRFYVEID